MKQEAAEHPTLKTSNGRGRKNRLTEKEEDIISEEVLKFHYNGTILSRACVCNIAAVLIKSFEPENNASLDSRIIVLIRNDYPQLVTETMN